MKLVFDYKIFYRQSYGGISEYFLNLYNEIAKVNSNSVIICPLYKNKKLHFLNAKSKIGFYFPILPSRLNFFFDRYNFFFSNYLIRKKKPDIIHETYYSSTDYTSSYKIKKVCTVFDMINEKFSNFFLNSKMITKIKKKTIERADHVFCISEKTKTDLIELFNVPKNKITVTLLAPSFAPSRVSGSLVKTNFFGNSLLFVGSRYGYKNFENFLKAFSISKFLKKNFKIIAYGGEKYGKYDYELIKKNNLTLKNIIFLNDKQFDLPFVYSNVSALIYPSIYEGFGLPLLEAMQSNCPVISSNGGSLPEVGGGGIKYFNPYDIENMSTVIEETLNSRQNLNQLIKYGINRYKKFSWSKCASQTMSIYKKINEHK